VCASLLVAAPPGSFPGHQRKDCFHGLLWQRAGLQPDLHDELRRQRPDEPVARPSCTVVRLLYPPLLV